MIPQTKNPYTAPFRISWPELTNPDISMPSLVFLEAALEMYKPNDYAGNIDRIIRWLNMHKESEAQGDRGWVDEDIEFLQEHLPGDKQESFGRRVDLAVYNLTCQNDKAITWLCNMHNVALCTENTELKVF